MELRLFKNLPIRQRSTDWYLSATDMCQIYGKLFGHYYSLKTTQEFLAALSQQEKIPTEAPRDGGSSGVGLVEIRKGGDRSTQGTYVHPEVAIHLAMWLDPMFCIAVVKWVHRYFEEDEGRASASNSQALVATSQLQQQLTTTRAELVASQTRVEELEQRVEAIRIARVTSQVVDSYSRVLANAEMDHVEKRFFKDILKNSVAPFSSQLAIRGDPADGGSQERLMKPLSDLVREVTGHVFDPSDYSPLGKRIADTHRERNEGRAPPQVERFVGGTTRMVYAYEAEDWNWVSGVIRQYYRNRRRN